MNGVSTLLEILLLLRPPRRSEHRPDVSTLLEILQIQRVDTFRRGAEVVSTLLEILRAVAVYKEASVSMEVWFQPFLRFYHLLKQLCIPRLVFRRVSTLLEILRGLQGKRRIRR